MKIAFVAGVAAIVPDDSDGAAPWGQTVARLQDPRGLLVGISYTPWMHPAPNG